MRDLFTEPDEDFSHEIESFEKFNLEIEHCYWSDLDDFYGVGLYVLKSTGALDNDLEESLKAEVFSWFYGMGGLDGVSICRGADKRVFVTLVQST